MAGKGRGTSRRGFGETGFEEWGGYMSAKKHKLEQQFQVDAARETSEEERQEGIFKGVAIFVNGYTMPSADELKRIMMTHGGIYHHYYDSTHTTHIIATNLPYAKIKQLKGTERLVKPDWITASLEAGKLLDHRPYLLYPNGSRFEPDKSSSKQQQKNRGIAATGDPNFLSEFYTHSRLHHISTMGIMLKQHVNSLREKSDGSFPRREQLKRKSDMEGGETSDEQVVVHIDMDCFFVSVGLRSRPELRGQPVAVTHSKPRPGAGSKEEGDSSHKESTSEISSCSYEARKAGVSARMYLGSALKLCPELQTIPYDFEAYEQVSKQLYAIVCEYTHQVEAVSCDEMFLDCREVLEATGLSAVDFVSALRADIESETGCTASAGLGPSRMVARLATKKAKPNGQFQVKKAQVEEFMAGQSVSDLPGVGYSTSKHLKDVGVFTCLDLQHLPLSKLQQDFGPKTGESLYNLSRGHDTRPLNMHHERKSVSAEVNYGIRLNNQEEADTFLTRLSEEVVRRLEEAGKVGRCITLKLKIRAKDAPKEAHKYMGHGMCDNVSKSAIVHIPTADAGLIARQSLQLLHALRVPPEDLRGIGIQLSQLQDLSSAMKPSKTLLDFVSSAKPQQQEQVTSPTKEVPAPVPLPTWSQLDPEVMAALPSDVQAEIRAQYHVENQTDEAEIAVKDVDKDKTELNSNEERGENDGGIPELCGMTQLSEIRPLLREWVASTDSPLEEDRKVMASFLIGLIHRQDIHKLRVLLKCLHRLIGKRNLPLWIKTYDTLVSDIQQMMIRAYGMELKLPSDFS